MHLMFAAMQVPCMRAQQAEITRQADLRAVLSQVYGQYIT